MKFYIYEHSLLNENQKQEIILNLNKKGLMFSNNIQEIEYLFVFGGDGTFLKALKEFANLNIKIILINAGKLGFLSSSFDYLEFSSNCYQKFDYLDISVDNTKFISINEVTIFSNKIQEIEFYINNNKFKQLLTNQINVVNNLGSTGINRSNIKPLIFPWNHQFIVDIKNEPIYNYYKPLLQPIITSNNDNVLFKFDNQNNIDLKIDNNIIYSNKYINEISISQKQSNCLILNLDNEKYFFDKLNKLF